VYSLDFADNISLLAELLELLVPALEIFQEETTPLGLEVNWQKNNGSSTGLYQVSSSVGMMSNVWNHLSS